MEANGLKLIQLESNIKWFHELRNKEMESAIAEHFQKNPCVVAYLDYKVLIGTWENNGFHFYELFDNNKYIQKLRIFNANQELLIWRADTGLKGRLRSDDLQGTGTQVIVAHQVLFGTRKGDKCKGNFTEITEDRGTSLILPFSNIQCDDKGNLASRIIIKTYNYVTYNEVFQASYEDCRFVGFSDGENDLT
ncbi:MAG TPA: TIGR03984 family CRISPR-associated protein [Nitrospirae bacterium]|nr:hypothetical protein BMS3Abin06_01645 [bacterium BMS3Abin06]HDH12016.1 TIGR03984 family CRISPR-associated protein [Nitrospirota bacterium]HDZ00836.1 TIGR03984 family CRISPR-associated protein [Nitrospirota bacterium]